MRVKHLDHLGIVVNDMERAKAFFTDLGFTLMGETTLEGEWVGQVIGLGYVRTDIAMFQAPDSQVNIELSKFHEPAVTGSIDPTPSNTLGMRHIALQVEDLDGIVDSLEQKGIKLVGDVHTYENLWKLCYVRGPEGILVELAEQLGG